MAYTVIVLYSVCSSEYLTKLGIYGKKLIVKPPVTLIWLIHGYHNIFTVPYDLLRLRVGNANSVFCGIERLSRVPYPV